ncbi:MAG: hypothetical protein ABIT36_11880 [Steroidobacteraceae bacterium]
MHRWKILLVSAVTSLTAGTFAQADITVEQRITVVGEGMMSMINMTGKTVQTISGDRSRTDTDLQFQSAMMRMLARGAGGQSVEIVQLGADKIYELNPRKKTYVETSFTERRAKLQEATAKLQEGQAAQRKAASGVDESQCEWGPAKSDVRRSGEKALIGGFTAEHVVITASQPCRDRSSGAVCEFGLTLDQWLAPDFKDSAETLEYQTAYAEKLGLTASSSREFSERAQSMFSGYKDIWTQIAAKMKDVKGYPVKAGFGLAIGGPQCQQAQQARAATSNGGGQPGLGALGGALGGLLGGRKSQSQPSSTPPVAAQNGMINLMTVSTELVSVNHDAAPASAFEPPANFKKTAE